MTDSFTYAFNNEDYELMEKILDKYEIELDLLFAFSGTTYLIEACKGGNEELVQFLLDHGADPDIIDYRRKSAVDYAVENDFQDIVNLLME